MSPLYIDATQVRELLTVNDSIQVIREAMSTFSQGGVDNPLRTSIPVDGSKSMLFMPGASRELGFYGAKLLSMHQGNAEKGLPSIQGFIVLFDYETGQPKAMIDGASVTGLRTAAASALATDLLARHSAETLGIYGTGLQAESHIDAIASIRQISEVLVWARRRESAITFAERQSARTGLTVKAVPDPAAVAGCDILCTVTASSEPILKGAWVKPGTHINLVGSHSLSAREADTELIAMSRVYVDSRESTLTESGDIMIPVQEKAIGPDHIVGEIGQVVSRDLAGRSNNHEVTLYKSLGITAQDLFSAVHIYRRFQCLTDG